MVDNSHPPPLDQQFWPSSPSTSILYLPSTNLRIDVVATTKPSDITSLLIPTVPGVIVALLGLFVGHLLTRSRERREEVRDLCHSIKNEAAEAAEAAVKAWHATDPSLRKIAVADTKRKVHIIGTRLTDLKRLTSGRSWASREPARINVSAELVKFRRACTNDLTDIYDAAVVPPSGPIEISLADLTGEIDRQFRARYR